MTKRRFGVLLLSFIICVVFSAPAFAAIDLDDPTPIKLDKTYSFYNTGEAVTFFIPAKGTITFHQSSSERITYSSYHEIYKSQDYDDEPVATIEPVTKYSNSAKAYVYDKKITLPAGRYYMFLYDEEYINFKYSINYKPSFNGTSITSLAKKKKGFTVKYKKSSAATGYQIRYSLKSNMANAKKVKTTKLSKSVSKLKSRKYYYVQVRTYKTVKVNGSNKTFYSSWSAKKKVKTK